MIARIHTPVVFIMSSVFAGDIFVTLSVKPLITWPGVCIQLDRSLMND